LQVVDDHQQRTIGRDVAQQRQDRVRDHEQVASQTVAETQSDVQGVGVQAFEPVQLAAQRKEKLVEGREALVLELRAGCPQDPDAGRRGCFSCGVQQGGLADARLPGQQQGSTLSRKPVDELLDNPHVLVASDELQRFAAATRDGA
jgi:hypothetical protein